MSTTKIVKKIFESVQKILKTTFHKFKLIVTHYSQIFEHDILTSKVLTHKDYPDFFENLLKLNTFEIINCKILLAIGKEFLTHKFVYLAGCRDLKL